MDYYFAAADGGEAVGALQSAGGLADGFDTVEAKDVMPCPHLEQLIEVATGHPVGSSVSELRTVWPPADTPAPSDENSPFLTGPTISQLPERIRDGLADFEVGEAVAEAWVGELWGYDTSSARQVAEGVTGLARRARAAGQQLFWWSEL